MEFNILKTRRGKLHNKINTELSKNEVNIDVILNYVDQYEKDNLETIEKLKRLKTLETKKINGALKQTINVHGPITKILIGSATKRIYGALLENEAKENIIKRVLKWIKI
jgi:hypothetical protein